MWSLELATRLARIPEGLCSVRQSRVFSYALDRLLRARAFQSRDEIFTEISRRMTAMEAAQ